VERSIRLRSICSRRTGSFSFKRKMTSQYPLEQLPRVIQILIDEYGRFAHPCATDIRRKWPYLAKWTYKRSTAPMHLVGHGGLQPQFLHKRCASLDDGWWDVYETARGVISTKRHVEARDFLVPFLPPRLASSSAPPSLATLIARKVLPTRN
jgi:hypothetical protein